MTEPRRPLEGIRVLELAQVVAGPFCGALMAEFGAEVIKTEMPGRGDDLRRLGPTEDGCTYWFAVDNRNKMLMTLDLHLPKGQDIVRRLVSHCDVVLENFRPGVLERWGLGWDALHAINPRRVMARRRVRDAGREVDRVYRAGAAPLRAPLRDDRAARAPARSALRRRGRAAAARSRHPRADDEVVRGAALREGARRAQGRRHSALADHEHGRHLRRPALPGAPDDHRRARRRARRAAPAR